MVDYHHILVPTDFSPSAGRAYRLAESLARESGAALTMVHTFDPTTLAFSGFGLGEGPVAIFAEDEVESRLHAQLLQTTKSAMGSLPEVDSILKLGASAAASIVELAEAKKSSLIVMSTEGRTGLAHMLIGSVTERVVRHAPCSVWAVRASREEEASPSAPRCIVVGTDLSPASDWATDEAARLARRFGSRVHLVWARPAIPWVPPARTSQLDLSTASGESGSEMAQLERVRDHRFEGIDAEIIAVESESPAHEICDQARRLDADLVIVGSHGRTGLPRWLVGSVAERVVRHAHCQTLVVRRPQGKEG